MTKINKANRSGSGLGAPRGDELLEINGAADYMAVSPRFVRSLVQERRIAFHKIGKFVRFRRGDLDAFIEAGRHEVWPR